MKIEQRDVIAIISETDLINFLGDSLYLQFKLNYKQALSRAGDFVIVRTCDLLGLLINYKTDKFVTYHQEPLK